ncbi:MAG: hypothetical protein R2746_12360 [Acidimicrobiales bacterium]
MASVAPGGEVAGPDDSGPQFGLLAGRASGFLRTFVDGMGAPSAATVLALLAAGLAVAAGLAARRRPGRLGEPAALLGAAVVLVVLRVLVAPDDLAGFAAAAPVVLAGLASWRWRDAPRPNGRWWPWWRSTPWRSWPCSTPRAAAGTGVDGSSSPCSSRPRWWPSPPLPGPRPPAAAGAERVRRGPRTRAGSSSRRGPARGGGGAHPGRGAGHG